MNSRHSLSSSNARSSVGSSDDRRARLADPGAVRRPGTARATDRSHPGQVQPGRCHRPAVLARRPAARRIARRDRAIAASTPRPAAANRAPGAPRWSAAGRPRSRRSDSRRARSGPGRGGSRRGCGSAAAASQTPRRPRTPRRSAARGRAARVAASPLTTSVAPASPRRAARDHAFSSAREASRGSRSGTPRAPASAPCSPAVSVPRSAATSVANSTLTSPGARIQAVRPSAMDS